MQRYDIKPKWLDGPSHIGPDPQGRFVEYAEVEQKVAAMMFVIEAGDDLAALVAFTIESQAILRWLHKEVRSLAVLQHDERSITDFENRRDALLELSACMANTDERSECDAINRYGAFREYAMKVAGNE